MLTSTKSKSKKSTAKKASKKASKKSTVKKSTSEASTQSPSFEGTTLCVGLRIQARDDRREVSFSLPGGSAFFISGLKSLNQRGEVIIHDMNVGGLPLNLIREVDAGFFNHRTYMRLGKGAGNGPFFPTVAPYASVGVPMDDACYVDPPGFTPMPIGCITTVSPLTISFSSMARLRSPLDGESASIATPLERPYLDLLFEGIFQASFGGCGFPYSGGSPGWPDLNSGRSK